MIKAVIFDFGGIFVPDEYNKLIRVQKRWVTPEGNKALLETENLGYRGKISRNDLFNKYTDIFRSQFLNDLDARMGQIFSHPRKRMISLAKKLKPNYKVGLLSNNFPFWVTKLKEQDYIWYFDLALFSSDVGLVKPEREIYKLALDRLGVAADETFYTDDQEENVMGARLAGINAYKYTAFDKLVTNLQEVGVTVEGLG